MERSLCRNIKAIFKPLEQRELPSGNQQFDMARKVTKDLRDQVAILER